MIRLLSFAEGHRQVLKNFTWSRLPVQPSPFLGVRSKRTQAFDAEFDPAELADARQWYASITEDKLPQGQTTYARSSGPGGQHVNKTESKAITIWTLEELENSVPKLLRSALRTSKFYSRRSSSITIQAQEQRSRSANTDRNHAKLLEELQRLYNGVVPGETSAATAKKVESNAKAANNARVQDKKRQSAKKASRKGNRE